MDTTMEMDTLTELTEETELWVIAEDLDFFGEDVPDLLTLELPTWDTETELVTGTGTDTEPTTEPIADAPPQDDDTDTFSSGIGMEMDSGSEISVDNNQTESSASSFVSKTNNLLERAPTREELLTNASFDDDEIFDPSQPMGLDRLTVLRPMMEKLGKPLSDDGKTSKIKVSRERGYRLAKRVNHNQLVFRIAHLQKENEELMAELNRRKMGMNPN
jgi:hypothetical protein